MLFHLAYQCDQVVHGQGQTVDAVADRLVFVAHADVQRHFERIVVSGIGCRSQDGDGGCTES